MALLPFQDPTRFGLRIRKESISAGSRPAHNHAIPVDDVSIIDTDAIRRLRAEHHVLTIVGGGVIGIEYACIAAALDIPVTMIERRPRILDFVDQETAEALSYHMRRQGVTFRLGEEASSVYFDSSESSN